jgi:hypothetical protein
MPNAQVLQAFRALRARQSCSQPTRRAIRNV